MRLAVALLISCFGAVAASAQTFPSSAGPLAVETFASGLVHPWGLQFLPDGRMLVTERPGRMRIVARDGKESILSISVKAYGTPSIVAKVSKGNFNPPPSVDSAILKIDGVSRDYFANISEEHFFKVVRAGFSSKRKKLASNLSIFGKQLVQTAFSECGLGENVRAEDVTLEEWGKLCGLLAA